MSNVFICLSALTYYCQTLIILVTRILSLLDYILSTTMLFSHANTPDRNIMSAQIRATSGTCRFHAFQMWAGSEPTLCCCLG